MSQPSSPGFATAPIANRRVFKAFLVSHVGNPADAHDLLQNGILKAFQRAYTLKDGEKTVAWFYQIIRNVIIDHGSSRGAARKRDDAGASGALGGVG